MSTVEPELVTPDLSRLTLPLTADELFGSARPMEIEIGCGKGTFLVAWAESRPETGLIGVERIRKYFELTARKAVRRGTANVRVLHTTAEDLLFRCLAPGSLAGVHVYFPDPWPKKRHHKRRFFSPGNVARVARVLRPGGLLRVKTDHPGYAEAIHEVLEAEEGLVACDADEAFADIPASGFEIKYREEGRPIAAFAYRSAERS